MYRSDVIVRRLAAPDKRGIPMPHLATRFALELVGLAAIGDAAFVAAAGGTAGLVAGVAAAVLFAIAWGRIAAPRADNRLAPRTRQLVGAGMLLAVAASLAWAGLPLPALAFAAAVGVNQVLLITRHAERALDAGHPSGVRA
jgi:hypothetical protein